MMKKIMIAWELGDGLGHLSPISAISAALIRHGCEVCVVTKNFDSARRYLKHRNVEILPLPNAAVPAECQIVPPLTYAHMLHNVGFGEEVCLRELVSKWIELFSQKHPDAIIFEHSPIGLFASQSLSVRRALMGTGFSVPPTPLPTIRSSVMTDKVKEQFDEERTLEVTNQVGASFGLPRLSSLDDVYLRAGPRFLRTYAELDHFGERDDTIYYGVSEEAEGKEPLWPKVDYPRAFAYLKSFKGGRGVIKQLSEMCLSTIVYCPSLGRHDAAALEKHLPNMRFSSEPIDMQSAARQCEIAICHGGHGMTARMLLAGIPVIAIPLQQEQVLLSQRLVATGAGMLVRPVESGQLSSSIDEVLSNPRYTDCAGRFASKYAISSADNLVRSVVDWVIGN